MLVLARDRPIAQITPLGTGAREAAGSRGRLERLQRQGLIRRGTGGLPEWLGRRKPPKLRGSVLKDLLEDRKHGW